MSKITTSKKYDSVLPPIFYWINWMPRVHIQIELGWWRINTMFITRVFYHDRMMGQIEFASFRVQFCKWMFEFSLYWLWSRLIQWRTPYRERTLDRENL